MNRKSQELALQAEVDRFNAAFAVGDSSNTRARRCDGIKRARPRIS